MMSNRTWVCVPCRKSFRRLQSVTSVVCSSCHGLCDYVHWKIRIPSPKRAREWNRFWTQYKAEMALLAAFHRGELREDVTLRLLNMRLHVAGENQKVAKRTR